MIRSQLVLTLIGLDRPGLVETIAAEVARHHGNWEESRMARLSGHFAGLLRVSVPSDEAQPLADALSQLTSAGLKLVVEPVDAPVPSGQGRSLRLELVGNDRPGIVRDLARVLSRRHVNVEELHTNCEAAPMAGGMLFRASALVRVPGEVALDELRTALESLADDLMVELSLSVDSDPHGAG
ncbi:MAG TPA: ACT domain-containing protein [Polyangiales bacterium]|nr:ACT domain-containing protein [Polyangiales bacterium]